MKCDIYICVGFGVSSDWPKFGGSKILKNGSLSYVSVELSVCLYVCNATDDVFRLFQVSGEGVVVVVAWLL